MPRITLDTVKKLKPGEIAWDSEVTGFGIRCQNSRKVYVLKARHRGRPVWFAIGEPGTYSPKKARAAAGHIKRELQAGVSPDKLRNSARGVPMIDGLIDRYIEEHIEAHLKPLTISTFKLLLNRHIRPAWGKRPVTDITSDDVAKLHHKMRKTPRSANQTMAVASKMFALAELWGLRPLNSNPYRHLKKYKENVRSRFYDDAELQGIGKAIAALEGEGELLPGCAALIRLAAMTGCRFGELLALQWDDVDLAAGVLTIRDAKAGARLHPVGASTVAYLTALERAGPWVCRGVLPDRRLSTRLAHYGWADVRDKAGLTDARFHDLRHSYGTFAGATGANAFMIKDAMGHKTLAMTGRYVARDADPMRLLVDRVSERVSGAMGGGNAEVVTMRRK